jgi:hypothetical protein
MSSLDLLLKQIDDPSELSWKEETYDLALAAGLDAVERTTFVSRLIDAARAGDARAVLTLGYIDAAETLPALQVLARARDPLAPTARRALVLLGRGAEIVDERANDALHSPLVMTRVAAVMDLPKIGGEIAIHALRQALADQDSTVRALAWDGLVQIFDLGRHIRNPETGKRELTTHVELLRVLLGSDISAFVKVGADEMCEIVDKLAAGASPASVGIAWSPKPAPDVFDRIRLALFDPEVAFPLDEIATLTGVPRRWAEMMLAMRLEEQDRRVPAAMARLGAEWTVPALEEVARSPSTAPELRNALRESIRTLQAS